ncbi:unnamed protein product [Miscanthus lutarioriparius]|uniref:Uncharacterized protein n=1 Tax=Miscanthus lutarioriparius TaxID=422564 RepID=A0A811NCQ5_9POAL|nr:unnamed protein product [Miscanthus lutarioriparius]
MAKDVNLNRMRPLCSPSPMAQQSYSSSSWIVSVAPMMIFVGEATIPLEAVYIEGSIPTTVYSVVKYEEYRGEIKVGLTFTPEDSCDQGF